MRRHILYDNKAVDRMLRKLSLCPTKKVVFLMLSLAMLLSGLRIGTTVTYVYATQSEIPLQTQNIRQNVIWMNQDLPIGRLAGYRHTDSVPNYSRAESRKRMLYGPGDFSCLTDELTNSAQIPFSTSELCRRNKKLHARSWIIRYIHDQDGEKDGAFLLI